MTIDINKNSALIDSASSGNGCGCGNRRYYTKAEIDEMFQGILDPEQIEELINSIIEEYLESGELYELIEELFGDIYTKAEIDQILADYATRNWTRTFVGNEMAAETARTESTYLKDITLTINGTALHNNGEIIIEGGGGEPVDISGKLDTTAFTQAMESETARTESTYAKKSEIPSLQGYATQNWVNSQGFVKDADISGKVDKTDFNSFTATTEQCCDFVRGEITDIWEAIAAITGDTPTPPVPGSSTGSTLYITYNVTSTTEPTKIMNNELAVSSKVKVYLSDGYEIIKTTGYTFQELGLNSLIYVFDPEQEIPINPYVLYQSNMPLNSWCGIGSIVEVGIMGDTRLFYGERLFNDCVNLTGITVSSDSNLWRLSGPSGCTSLSNVSIPSNTPMAQFGGFDYCPLITGISIPDSVQIVVYSTLNGTGISTIQLPSNLSRMGGRCFNDCSNLGSIYFSSVTPPVSENISNFLGETEKSFPIYVPAESVTEYKRNSYYQHYANRIEAIPNE